MYPTSQRQRYYSSSSGGQPTNLKKPCSNNNPRLVSAGPGRSFRRVALLANHFLPHIPLGEGEPKVTKEEKLYESADRWLLPGS